MKIKNGCAIERNDAGMYDLTIYEDGQPVKVFRNLSFNAAIARADRELHGKGA